MGVEPTNGGLQNRSLGRAGTPAYQRKPPRAPWAYPKPEATGNTAVDNQAYRKISQGATDSSEDYPFKPLPLVAVDRAAALCLILISGDFRSGYYQPKLRDGRPRRFHELDQRRDWL